jgi:hypothetical protein
MAQWFGENKKRTLIQINMDVNWSRTLGAAHRSPYLDSSRSEADVLEAGDCLDFKTVGRPSGGPK